MDDGTIRAVQIGVNRYGGDGAERIMAYAYNGCENLTLGQLVTAICCKTGMTLEAEAVNMMNETTRRVRRTNALSEIIVNMMNDASYGYQSILTCEGYAGVRVIDFLTNELHLLTGEGEGFLPSSLDTPADRLQFYTAVKSSLDAQTTESQKRMISLQTCLTRRDVMFSTATNVVLSLGTALTSAATAL